MALKPDCAVCGQPYFKHNIGSSVFCPIIATYRPATRPPASGVAEEGGRPEMARLRRFAHDLMLSIDRGGSPLGFIIRPEEQRELGEALRFFLPAPPVASRDRP